MNAAEIRKLIAEHDMSALDRLEQEVYASMDDDANDVAELGDRLTNILGAKRVLEEAENKGSSPRSPSAPFSKTCATSLAEARPSINNSFTMGMTEILLAIGLLALGVAGIAIKILVKPNGEFSGTCSSNNPMLRNEDGGCSVCGARPQDACRAEEPT